MPYAHRNIVLLISVLVIGSWLLYPNLRESPRPHTSGPIPGADTDILNETLGFQKVFVINLPSRSDRRDAMTLASALTGIKFGWIDGVAGDQVLEKVLPPDSIDKNISKGNRGSWRVHMNVLRTIVQQNLTSALILEDDIDWDIRLKFQLQNFSLASRSYLQHVSSTASSQPTTLSLPSLLPLSPAASPYGSHWDVLWLGHCGTSFPSSQSLRVIMPLDTTVPSHQHLRPHPFAGPDEPLISSYPPHTRVIHAPGPGTACTQAYAVSRSAALKLLYRFGTQTFTTGWDLMLGDWCAGLYDQGLEGNKRERPVCVTVQPPLFVQHYGKGGASDITAPGGGFIDRGKEMTPYVRLSVRLNMAALVRGAWAEGLSDQWPD
ncbi:hypothetical protein BR93DRAFT_887437 [Coniochaeta sp. PMI_546]|nr:hypothetical protein BR93DRAFT_887437 [Coniochaeta sp. PMI_546]